MIHEIIKNRFSTRAFSDKLIDEQKIINIFEAARWAPSAMNAQPWNFIAVTKDDSENYEKMVHILNDRNQVWASRAPLLILALAKIGSDGLNRNFLSLYDLGLAVENLCLQATAEGLHTHQMGGFDKEKARKLFEIPDDYLPVVVIAAGNKGTLNNFPDSLKERELLQRKRRPLNEILFEGKFGLHGKITKELQNYD